MTFCILREFQDQGNTWQDNKIQPLEEATADKEIFPEQVHDSCKTDLAGFRMDILKFSINCVIF